MTEETRASDLQPAPLRIAIIGGGPGGLFCAYYLQRKLAAAGITYHATIFEMGSRLGGKILTETFAAAKVRYEAGVAELYGYPQATAETPDALHDLVEDLGLTTSPMAGEAVIVNGTIYRQTEDLPAEALAEVQRFINTARATVSPEKYADFGETDVDPLDDPQNQPGSDMLADVADPLARRYLKTAMHSDLATEPHQTSALYLIHNWVLNEADYMQVYTIDGGIESLVTKLSERIAGETCEVRLETSVVRAEQNPGFWTLTLNSHGEQTSEAFDRILVCLPNNYLTGIDWRPDALAESVEAFHDFYHYPAHYLRVSVLFKTKFWRDLIAESWWMSDQLGGCCVYDESSRTDADGDDAGKGVLGWLLAGDAALNFANLENDDLVDRCLDSLPDEIRDAGHENFIEGSVHRWLGAVNGLPSGYPEVPPAARKVAFGHADGQGDGSHPGIYFVGDYLFDSTVNGALMSAMIVTDQLAGVPVEQRCLRFNQHHGADGKFASADGAGASKLSRFAKVLKSIPARVAQTVKSKASAFYAKMEQRYGPKHAKAILAVALVTLPTPFTTPSVLAAAALASLSVKFFGKRSNTPGGDMTKEQIEAAAREAIAALEAEMASVKLSEDEEAAVKEHYASRSAELPIEKRRLDMTAWDERRRLLDQIGARMRSRKGVTV